MPVTTTEKLAELLNERSYRQRVFARLVAERRMTQPTADARMRVLDAIIADYRERDAEERLT
jgi:hypothetical protein